MQWGLAGFAAKGPSQALGVQRSVLQSCGAEKGQVQKVQFLQGQGETSLFCEKEKGKLPKS